EKSAAEAKRLAKELESARADHKKDALVLSSGQEKNTQQIEKLSAQLREADYARNEAVKIQNSANDARKRAEGQAEQLEAKLKDSKKHQDELQAKVAQLEKSKSSAPAAAASSSSGGGDSDARVQKLEREKAEILLESKREIERLTREQDVL